MRVKELAQKRNLLFFFHQLSVDIEKEDIEQVVRSIIIFLDNFGLKERSVDYEALSSEIFKFAKQLDMERKTETELFLNSVSTGFTDLDMLTKGFKKGELIVLSAPADMGKTSFMLSTALNIARQGKSVGIMNFELDKAIIHERLLSIASEVPLKKIRERIFYEKDFERITQAVVELSTLKIFILHSTWFTLSEIYYKTKRLKEEKGLDILFIDYLQLINAETKRATRQEELEDIVRNIKAMAIRLEIPIVLLTQMFVHTKDKIPKIERLREIGKIEEFADTILFLHRPEYYQKYPKPEIRGIAEIIVAKNRNGAKDTIRLAFINETTAFKNLKEQNIQGIYDFVDDEGDWNYFEF